MLERRRAIVAKPKPLPDPHARRALAHILVVLADNKHLLGLRLSESAVGAPALESAVALAAIAQEELGHSRVLYSLLETLPADDAPGLFERNEDHAPQYSVSYVVDPFSSWYEAVAAQFLLDTAMTTLLGGCRDSAHDGLRRRAMRILGDEEFHRKFVRGRIRELVATRERERLIAQINALLPETLCWFGPPGERGVERLRAGGILTGGSEELRWGFLDAIATLAAEAGLVLPLKREGVGWNYGELPWSEWLSPERRLKTKADATATS